MDVVALRNEIRLLERRHSKLQNRLSVLQSTSTPLSSVKVMKETASRDFNKQELTDLLLAHGQTNLREQEEFDAENLHRLTGITAFRVKNEPACLGVRIESFSEQDGTFAAPYYMILKRAAGGKGFGVFKHTIPSHVPLKFLEKHYLGEKTNLLEFVRKVRRGIKQFQKKRQVFAELESLGAGVDTDEAYRLVRVSLHGIKYTLVCSLTRVERVVEKHGKPYLLGTLSGLRRRIERANR